MFNAYLASPDWIKGLAVILAFAAPSAVLMGLAWLAFGQRRGDKTAGDRLTDPPDPACPLVYSVQRAPDGTLRRFMHPGNGSPVELPAAEGVAALERPADGGRRGVADAAG